MKYLNYLFLLPYVLAVFLPIGLYFRWRPRLSRSAAFFISTSILVAFGSLVVVRIAEMVLLFPIIQASGVDRNPTIIAEQSVSAWIVLLLEIAFVMGFTCVFMRKMRSALSEPV